MSSRLIVNSIRHTGATGDAVTLANDGTCTANITNRSNRNLIINGAMNVAQRGTSSASSGYQTVDRFSVDDGGVDEASTKEQAAVTSGGAYDSGFRNCLKITNGNQTGGAGASDYIQIMQRIEAQNMANSGWNYPSSSSFITLSFWVKSSVAQVYSGSVRTQDGTGQSFKFDTPSLSANTWTKVTKTIPGNSNLTFADDNGHGFDVFIYPFIGTTYTSSNANTETWIAGATNTYANNMTSTWYTTNNATFEVTGVQLEVGSVATDFEHLTFADDLRRCERYYQIIAKGAGTYWGGVACNYGATHVYMPIQFRTRMRTSPTLVFASGSNYYQIYDSGNTGGVNFNRPQSLSYQNELGGALYVGPSYISGLSVGQASLWYALNAAALIAVEAEL